MGLKDTADRGQLYDDLFYQALRIRLIEEKIIELYPSDKIQSPVHLSIGQEAVAVGACKSLKKEDQLFFNYRSHAFYLAKGGDLNQMMAELYGKIDGCGRGKAGSMHLLAPEVGVVQASAVVAAAIPQAVGAALALKHFNKNDQIIVAVFGDGATEEGVFHESLNFAALHQLPILFLCENNGLAVHSRIQSRHSFQISDFPKQYGIPTTTCQEGIDFVKVYEDFSKEVDLVRKNRTPRFIEIKTFRYKEHVGPGDDFTAGYRNSSEMQEWTLRDPLILDQERVKKLTPGIKKEIDAAVLFAEKSPFPSQEELLSDVY